MSGIGGARARAGVLVLATMLGGCIPHIEEPPERYASPPPSPTHHQQVSTLPSTTSPVTAIMSGRSAFTASTMART